MVERKRDVGDGVSGHGPSESGGPNESGDGVATGADQPPKLSIGAEALKAFAHPLRMAMYSRLHSGGPATASQLGRALGESSGQTSYHLRQLERHGFVEDDPSHSGGRERWWRAVGFNMDSLDLLADPATEGSARALLHQSIAERAGTLTAWANRLEADSEWVGVLGATTVVMTLEEADALQEELLAVVRRHTEPLRGRDDGGAPAGARRVRIHTDLFPLVTADDERAEGPAVD